MVVPQRQGLLGHNGTLLPEPLGGLVVNVFAKLIKDDADKFPRMEPCIERFEAGNLLGDRRGDARRFLFGDDLDIVQEQAEHTLVLEAPPELAHGFWVGLRFVGALPGRTVFKEDQGTDEFIAPLDLIDKAQLQLRKVTDRFHASSFMQAHRGPHGGGERLASPRADALLLDEPWASPARSGAQMVRLREGPIVAE